MNTVSQLFGNYLTTDTGLAVAANAGTLVARLVIAAAEFRLQKKLLVSDCPVGSGLGHPAVAVCED